VVMTLYWTCQYVLGIAQDIQEMTEIELGPLYVQLQQLACIVATNSYIIP